MTGFERVADAGDIPPGSGRAFTVKGMQVAVFNVGGTYHAIANECCHAGWALADGEVQGEMVVCPGHGWDFNLRTGASGGIPGARVAAYKCKIENGGVFVLVG